MYLSGRELTDLYNNTLEKHILLNNLFIVLGNTNELLDMYLQKGSPEYYERYTKTYPTLLESGNSLENIMSNDKGRRAAIDLKYMIQSYIEEGNAAIAFHRENNIEKSNKHYFEARKIYKLINGNFQKVFSLIIADTHQLKVKIIDNKNRQFTLNRFVILLSGLFSIVFMQWVSASMTKPINRLTKAAVKVSKGELDLDEMPVTSNDEIGILTQVFNNMVERINFQISEIKSKAEIEKKLKDEEMENLRMKNLLREAELKSLQSRINPHFLFNSLNIVSQLAYIEGAAQTVSILESMTDLLRYNLDKFNKIVTIGDEIENLKDYVYIQKKRFGERIQFEIKEEQEAAEGLIPCLIIQPLLENSIIHGVQTYTANGLVGVEVLKKGERVNIRIYDNGVGIEESKLKDIEKMLNEGIEDGNSGSIGLANVIARLKLFYNNDVVIKMSSVQGKGTEINLNIPYKIEKDGGICTA